MKLTNLLTQWFAHPLTRGMDIDHPQTTAFRKQIISSKPFLKKLYEEWYCTIAAEFPPDARVLELGSGAGFLKEFMPSIITSELFPTPGVDLVIDAQAIDMPEGSIDGIVMTGVLHHIADCNRFFQEASRVIRNGGKIVMIEPWNTGWSRWVYMHLHHEPFEPDAQEWRIQTPGPLSGANGALPWIILQRDRTLFEARFPQWRVVRIVPIMPVAYLLSGGVSLQSLFPGWMYQSVRFFEKNFKEELWAMFALFTLERQA
jgi:SAM-dependent methyltransferase